MIADKAFGVVYDRLMEIDQKGEGTIEGAHAGALLRLLSLLDGPGDPAQVKAEIALIFKRLKGGY